MLLLDLGLVDHLLLVLGVLLAGGVEYHGQVDNILLLLGWLLNNLWLLPLRIHLLHSQALKDLVQRQLLWLVLTSLCRVHLEVRMTWLVLLS